MLMMLSCSVVAQTHSAADQLVQVVEASCLVVGTEGVSVVDLPVDSVQLLVTSVVDPTTTPVTAKPRR